LREHARRVLLEALRVEQQRLVELIEEPVERVAGQLAAITALELAADLVARRFAVEQLHHGEQLRRQRRLEVAEVRRVLQLEERLSLDRDAVDVEGPEARAVIHPAEYSSGVGLGIRPFLPNGAL